MIKISTSTQSHGFINKVHLYITSFVKLFIKIPQYIKIQILLMNKWYTNLFWNVKFLLSEIT